MSEADAIRKTQLPATVGSLKADLENLGLKEGATVIVHSSLSAIGWVAGGSQAVIEALLESIGPRGTLVMPAHTSHLSEPSAWENPPVPESWWPIIRSQMTPYDPARTPTRGMGAIAEAFRSWPGVVRSSHPARSFAARGPNANLIVDNHSLDHPFGEGSPLARIYDLDGSILLLGVGHASNTSIHLAEHRGDWPDKKRVTSASPILDGPVRRWVEYADLDEDFDFSALGSDFAARGLQVDGAVGLAPAFLMRQRALVDFAVSWLPSRRGETLP